MSGFDSKRALARGCYTSAATGPGGRCSVDAGWSRGRKNYQVQSSHSWTLCLSLRDADGRASHRKWHERTHSAFCATAAGRVAVAWSWGGGVAGCWRGGEAAGCAVEDVCGAGWLFVDG